MEEKFDEEKPKERRKVMILVVGMKTEDDTAKIFDELQYLPGVIQIDISLEDRLVVVWVLKQRKSVEAEELLDAIDNLGYDTDLIDDGNSDDDDDYRHKSETLVMDDNFIYSDNSSYGNQTPYMLSYDEKATEDVHEILPDRQNLKRMLIKIEDIAGSPSTFHVERNLSQIQGVRLCNVCLLTGETEVEYEEGKLTSNEILSAITNMGFKPQVMNELQQTKYRLVLKISGMTSSTSADVVEKTLLMLNGIKFAAVDFLRREAKIVYDGDETSPRTIIQQLQDSGVQASIDVYGESPAEVNRSNRSRMRFLICLFISLPVVAITIYFIILNHADPSHFNCCIIPGLSLENLLLFIFTMPVLIYASYRFYKSMYETKIQRRRHFLNIDMLHMAAILMCFAYSIFVTIYSMIVSQRHATVSLFPSTIFLILVMFLAHWLEDVAMLKSTESERMLRYLQANEALLVEQEESNGMFSEKQIAARLVETGDLLKVQPGSKIPVDGNVIAGSSSVDESLLTGDSISVLKNDGSQVIGGSVNQEGVLFIRASKVGKDTILSKIIKLVQNIRKTKAPIQRTVDKFMGYMVLIICGLGILNFVLWMIVGFSNGDIFDNKGLESRRRSVGEITFQVAFSTTISVIVVTNPYALSIATTIAIHMACSVGSLNGILIRTGKMLQVGSKISTIVFDKRGMLTSGNPTVSSIRLFIEEKLLSLKLFFAIVGVAESNSTHPISKAITDFIQKVLGGHTFGTCSKYKSVPGSGIKCTISNLDFHNLELHTNQERSIDDPDNNYEVSCFGDVPVTRKPSPIARNLKDFDEYESYEVLIGNREWITRNEVVVTQEINRRMEEVEIQGDTAVLVAINGVIAAIITIEDLIKPEAALAANKLKQMNIDVILLTGDSKLTATYVSKRVGLSSFYANLQPLQKCEKIKELQKEGKRVAMIGDGYNDLAALAQADVSINVGISNDSVMNETNVVLLKKDLIDALTFIDLSRSTIRRIRINIVMFVIYSIIGLLLAAGLLFPLNFIPKPWMASLMMVFASTTIIGSSLLLRFYKVPSISNPSFSRLHRSRFEDDPGCRNPVYQSAEDLRSGSQVTSGILANTKM